MDMEKEIKDVTLLKMQNYNINNVANIINNWENMQRGKIMKETKGNKEGIPTKKMA